MRDRIIDCLAYDGKVSIKCISSTNLVEEARKITWFKPNSNCYSRKTTYNNKYNGIRN